MGETAQLDLGVSDERQMGRTLPRYSHIPKNVLRLKRLVLNLGQPEPHLAAPWLALVCARSTTITAPGIVSTSVAITTISSAGRVLRPRWCR